MAKAVLCPGPAASAPPRTSDLPAPVAMTSALPTVAKIVYGQLSDALVLAGRDVVLTRPAQYAQDLPRFSPPTFVEYSLYEIRSYEGLYQAFERPPCSRLRRQSAPGPRVPAVSALPAYWTCLMLHRRYRPLVLTNRSYRLHGFR